MDQGRKWNYFRAIAQRVRSCGSHLVFHDYYRVNQCKLVDAKNCDSALLCPFCAGRRAVNHLRNAVPKLLQVIQQGSNLVPYLLTITIRDEEKCGAMFKRLRKLWTRCLEIRKQVQQGKRSWSPWAAIDGGIMSFEVKRGSGSGLWHVHGHAVVLGPPDLQSSDFQRSWSDLVGYWAQCDLRKLSSAEMLARDMYSIQTEKALASDLMEVFKYALKFNAMTFEDRFTAYREITGQRLVCAFGSLRGVKLSDEVTDDTEGLELEPYYRLVYRAIGMPAERAYSLRKSEYFEAGARVGQVVINMDVVDGLDSSATCETATPGEGPPGGGPQAEAVEKGCDEMLLQEVPKDEIQRRLRFAFDKCCNGIILPSLNVLHAELGWALQDFTAAIQAASWMVLLPWGGDTRRNAWEYCVRVGDKLFSHAKLRDSRDLRVDRCDTPQ